MLSQEEQVAIFVDAINRKAAMECKKIEKETKRLYTIEAEKLQQAAQTNMEKRLAYAKVQALTGYNKSIAKNHVDCRRRIAEKRKEIENRVFGAVKENLTAFTKESAYIDFLRESLMKLGRYSEKALTVWVREADAQTVKRLIDEMKLGFSIKTDRNISVGGIKAETEEKIIDDTLDARLEEQKESFYSGSGLIANF